MNACTSCHMSHDSVAPARLLRPATPAAPALRSGHAELHDVSRRRHVCVAGAPEHSWRGGEDQSSTAIRESTSTMLPKLRCSTTTGMPLASIATTLTPPTQTCTFSAPPQLRPSQAGVLGSARSDGVTALTPAINQYENCLRCHGTSLGKQRLLIYGYAPIASGCRRRIR